METEKLRNELEPVSQDVEGVSLALGNAAPFATLHRYDGYLTGLQEQGADAATAVQHCAAAIDDRLPEQAADVDSEYAALDDIGGDPFAGAPPLQHPDRLQDAYDQALDR